jgi:hypothetical protein
MKIAPFSLKTGRFFVPSVGARLVGESDLTDAFAGKPGSYR